MFLLSILPTPISGDSNNKPVNLKNKVDTLEHTIMALESLLTGERLGQIDSIDQDGVFDQQTHMLLKKLEDELKHTNPKVDFSNPSFVKTILGKKRHELISIHKTNDDDATSRLKEINVRRQVADIRLDDLNKLLNFRKVNPYGEFDLDPTIPGIQYVSGVWDKDLNSINKEIAHTKAYKKELADAKTFWNTVSHFPHDSSG